MERQWDNNEAELGRNTRLVISQVEINFTQCSIVREGTWAT
jgi:hypothetical protein